jgi:GNAT superfamily N-acetyltransferase
MGTLTKRPFPLQLDQIIKGFDCGHEDLNVWFKNRALVNQQTGASRTFITTRDDTVTGFFALATGQLDHSYATGKVKRNMPDPLPAIILGRLAVDIKFQRKGIGFDLLKDAMLRVIYVSEYVGIRALIVHAKSEEAKTFYMKYGFSESPLHSRTLMILVKDLRENCGFSERLSTAMIA